MHVTVLYEGPLRRDHGGRRQLEQVLWLAERHSVTLVPLQSTAAADVSSEVSDAGVLVMPPLQLPIPPRWAGALPGLWRIRHPPPAYTVPDGDWLVVANTALAGWVAKTSRQRGLPVTSWDGDAQASWYLSVARVHPWHPRRTLVALTRAISMAVFETQRLRRFDFVTVPSDRDRAALALTGISRAYIVPNTVGVDARAGHRPLPSDLLFVGSNYGPNIDGLRWFFDRVWPAVLAARPSTTLHLVGNGLEPEALSEQHPGTVWHGSVERVEPYLLGARLFVCPVFYGGGTPNKVVEAAACGLEVLTTPYVQSRLPQLALGGARDETGWIRAILDALARPPDTTALAEVANIADAGHGPAAFDAAMLHLEKHVLDLIETRRAPVVAVTKPDKF